MSDFAKMNDEAKASALSEATRALQSAPNGELRRIRERIAAFEETHGFTSADMQGRLSSGQIRETRDVCDWLMLLNLELHLGAIEAH